MLEKILEEIDNLKKLYVEKAFNLIDEGNLSCEYDKSDVEAAKVQALSEAMAIIRKHLSGKDTNVPANDGWIPVEERLPEQDGAYLISCDDVNFPVKRMRYDSEVKPYGLFYDIYGIYNGEVYAWQPLPEPYRPKKGEE